jgi:hypothetical protein
MSNSSIPVIPAWLEVDAREQAPLDNTPITPPSIDSMGSITGPTSTSLSRYSRIPRVLSELIFCEARKSQQGGASPSRRGQGTPL